LRAIARTCVQIERFAVETVGNTISIAQSSASIANAFTRQGILKCARRTHDGWTGWKDTSALDTHLTVITPVSALPAISGIVKDANASAVAREHTKFSIADTFAIIASSIGSALPIALPTMIIVFL